LHDFSFINTPKTESSSCDEEYKNPKIEILKYFGLLNMLKYFGHDFASHDALGY